MEPMFTAAALEMKARMKERGKKIPEELSSYFTTDLAPGFTPSLNARRSAVCPGEHAERHEDVFLNDDIARKKPNPVLPKVPHRSRYKTTREDTNPKVSQISLIPQADKDSPLNMLNENVAASMLQELGEKLHLLARCEAGFPRGLVNVLTRSWRQLTKGAGYGRWHQKSLVYRSVRSRRRQASEELKSSAPGSKCAECEIPAIRREQNKKSFALPACTTKAKRKPEAASNIPVGRKGWVFQLSDSTSEDIYQTLPYVWTAERLEQIKPQMEEQTSRLKKVGVDKPIILRHYGDHRKAAFSKTWNIQTGMTVTPDLTYGKPEIPGVRKAGTAQRKLHYGLNDGSSFIYYPSEYIAVCQSCCNLPCGGFYTNIFSPSPDHSIVGTFTPFGHGSICLPNSNTVTVMFDQEGGMVTNKDGEMVREWKWPWDGKLAQPVIAQVNEYITVRIAGRFAISLVYKWQHESVCLSLSPLQGVALPQLEELPKLTELSMKSEVPEATISHTSATRELRNLQQKIWTIVDDWLQYYCTALGTDRIRLQKMSDLPLQPVRKGTVQSADTLPVASGLQRSQGKRKENSQAPKSETPLLYQTPLAPHYGMQREQYSYSLRASISLCKDTKPEELHMAQFNLNKRSNVLNVINSGDKLQVTSQAACPAVLRRVMMGEEGKTCRCSNRQIPYVSDLEYDHLISNQVSFKEQVIVVCVSSSSQTNRDPNEYEIEQLYERKNKNRSMPCVQGCLDSFRLLKYDTASADAFTDRKGSLLEKRHNVAPGMVLMYVQGKLLFANYIFNGYSKSTKDLQKQIVKTRSDYRMGYCLPSDFKFSVPYENKPTNLEAAKEKRGLLYCTTNYVLIRQQDSTQKSLCRGMCSNPLMWIPSNLPLPEVYTMASKMKQKSGQVPEELAEELKTAKGEERPHCTLARGH